MSPNIVNQSSLDNQDRLRALQQQLMSGPLLTRVATEEELAQRKDRRPRRPARLRSGIQVTVRIRWRPPTSRSAFDVVPRLGTPMPIRHAPSGSRTGWRPSSSTRTRSCARPTPRTHRRSSPRSGAQARRDWINSKPSLRPREGIPHVDPSCLNRRRRTSRHFPACASSWSRTPQPCAANRIVSR